MSKQKHFANIESPTKVQHKSVSASGQKTVAAPEVTDLGYLNGLAFRDGNAQILHNRDFPCGQRQTMAAQIGYQQGNRHLGKLTNYLQFQKKPQDEAVHWYQPWIRDVTIAPGSLMKTYKVEPGSMKRVDSGWQRNALDNAALAVFVSIATEVITKRLPKAKLFEYLSPAIAGYMAYENIEAQERVWGMVVDIHDWYGRYRYNLLTGEILAVRFDGNGPSQTTFIIPYYYQQRIADKRGNALYEHTLFEFSISGIKLPGSRLPEKNFGEFK